MSNDPFDELLELENDFYQEGYDAGVSDSEYAGMIEGKIFGVEKGYEKAFELAKFHGRAAVWQRRLHSKTDLKIDDDTEKLSSDQQNPVSPKRPLLEVNKLAPNDRLKRHVESLLAITELSALSKENSDDAVAIFDEKLSKAKTKAKIIANTVGEALNPISLGNSGIEDATGLQARH